MNERPCKTNGCTEEGKVANDLSHIFWQWVSLIEEAKWDRFPHFALLSATGYVV